MDMHAAALPPRSGTWLPRDTAHPQFAAYRQHCASCSRLMIDAPAFADWLSCREREQRSDDAAQHPRFREFQQWMRDTRAGGRACRPTRDLPRGLAFPANFHAWLDGERW